MRERAGIAEDGTKRPKDDAAEQNSLTPCTEIIRRYELLRYNLYKEKYEKHVKHGV